MSHKILILTDSIAPPAFAPRVVSLCRHLTGKGWDCVVFSDREKGVPAFSDDCGTWYQTAYYQSGNERHRYIADKIFDAREKEFMRFIESQVRVADFDVIFCSTCYYFPLQTTLRLARKYDKPFIVDIRDIAEQWGKIAFNTFSLGSSTWMNRMAHRIFSAVNIRRRNRVLEAADHVITISPWHQGVLSRYNPNTHLVYNGFDKDEFYPRAVRMHEFIISYAGKIYNLLFRDPRLVFEALEQLIKEIPSMQRDLRLVFHVDEGSILPLRRMASQYGLEPYCDISGYIPKSELLTFLQRSSILLVLTCKSTPEGAHGIMGTKFFEAMGVEKPVLCVRSDEECLAQVIEETNAGLAASEVESVKRFIIEIYREWQTKGHTHRKIQNKSLFSRNAQSDQILQIIKSVIR